MNMKTAMRKKICAIDFALHELTLYLDTHTWDKRALTKRNALLMERRQAVADYEARFGKYIVIPNDVDGDRWAWVDDPWPWEYCAMEEM